MAFRRPGKRFSLKRQEFEKLYRDAVTKNADLLKQIDGITAAAAPRA